MWCSTVGIMVTLSILVGPLVTDAQRAGKVVHIGVLSPYAPPSSSQPSPIGELVRQVLRERGWVEGENLLFERRYSAGQVEQLPALAAELVQLPVDVILAIGTSAAQAAQHATRTIPIVFVLVSDPVGSGLAASLAQPGANVTGIALTPTVDITGKRLQLLTEAVPQVSRVVALWNPANPTHPSVLSVLEKTATALGVSLHTLAVRDPTELARTLHTITDEQANGLFVPGDPMLDMQHSRIAQFAIEHRVPTISLTRDFVTLGGLMSYGVVYADIWRRAVALVDKILRGATPADLPIEQPAKFELVINLKTAQALGLTISPTLLFQADEVIR